MLLTNVRMLEGVETALLNRFDPVHPPSEIMTLTFRGRARATSRSRRDSEFHWRNVTPRLAVGMAKAEEKNRKLSEKWLEKEKAYQS